MSDFKVNSKTKILRFKEQHNKLCDAVDEIPNIIDSAIQADKDIISQIEVEWDEVNSRTIITLPKFVYPLSISVDGEEYHFDYANDNIVFDGITVVGDIAYEDTYIILRFNYEYIKEDISSLDYIMFSGNNRSSYFENTYYLYHPITNGGTKLYRHELIVDAFAICVVTNKADKFESWQQIYDCIGAKNQNGDVVIQLLIGGGGPIYHKIISEFNVNRTDNTLTLYYCNNGTISSSYATSLSFPDGNNYNIAVI